MGKLRSATMFIICLLLLVACEYETADEAIRKDIPFNIKQIIHKEKTKDGWLIFYTTKQKEGSKKVVALSAAYIKGSKEDGWKNAGHNHWTYYKNDFMILYADAFHIYKQNGELEEKLPVIFGKVMNPDIKTIEASGPDGKFTKIEIIKKGNDRYYYAVGDFKQVRALNAEGKELDRQGKK